VSGVGGGIYLPQVQSTQEQLSPHEHPSPAMMVNVMLGNTNINIQTYFNGSVSPLCNVIG